MAKRPYFLAIPEPPFFEERTSGEFKYEGGFSLSQARKCIENLHQSIRTSEGSIEILEVSTKSPLEMGVKFSAFSLSYLDNSEFRLENVFQASKVFEHGGPYRDILRLTPREAKRAPCLQTSGRLVCFLDLDNQKWNLSPSTAYYDWIYIHSAMAYLRHHSNEIAQLTQYAAFTDIAFNPKKSINCQARSLAMLVGMLKANSYDLYENDPRLFRSIYENNRAE